MDKVISYEVNEGFSSGTSLQGYVSTTYDRLVELFGQPTYTDGRPYEKVNAEWVLTVKVQDGDDEDDWGYHDVTIYNWNTGSVPTDEYSWHVGGRSFWAQDYVEQILNNNLKPENV